MNLDENAGGRMRPEVADAVARALRDDLANPSSVHAAGRRARARVEEAREAVAALVGARPGEVVFTSGGTEANALAVAGGLAPGGHAVSTAIEHVSVLRAIEGAVAAGAMATLVAPGPDGLVDPAAVAGAVDGRTALVSVGWANGEIGTVQPIAAIAAAVRERAAALGRGVLLHSDAVQAVATVDIGGAAADLDLVALSGHKLRAPTGVGALVVRAGTGLRPLLRGGAQERERRAGTENVPGIVGFGVAARLALAERESRRVAALALRERLWAGLAALAAPAVRLGRVDGLAGTLAVAFAGTRGDALVLALDLEGIAASAGAACAAGAAEPSHVLRGIGLDPALARGVVRFSPAPDLCAADVDRAIGRIAAVVARARGGGAGEASDAA